MPGFNCMLMVLLFSMVASAAAPERKYVIDFDEADHKGDRASIERVSATIIRTSTKFDDQQVESLIDAAGDEKHYASFSTVRKYKGEGTSAGSTT